MWLKKENSKKSEKCVGTENLPYASIIMLVSYLALTTDKKLYSSEPTRNSKPRIICHETTKRV